MNQTQHTYPGRLYLLDFRNLFHRNAQAHRQLSHNGVFTGGLYGIYQAMCRTVFTFGPGRFVVANDCRPYARSVLFPGYKANRKQVARDSDWGQSLDEGMALCFRFFEELGVQFVEIKGLEADDIIASMSYRYADHFEHGVVVLSNDSDLFQLLRPNVSVFRSEKKKSAAERVPRLYTLRRFTQAYRITTDDWIWVTAMTGTHNAVPGISGIGIKSALDVARYGEESKFWATINKEENQNLIARNTDLIRLPLVRKYWPEGAEEKLLLAAPKGSARRAMRFLTKHGINLKAEYEQKHLETISEHSYPHE